MEGIDWKAYYQKEPEVCDFDPANDAHEIHRCLAAWSVFPRKGVCSILDVGCGDGYFCHWITGKLGGDRVVGLDVSEGRLARARARYPQVEYRLGEIEHLPFDGPEFDVATSIEILEHQTDPLVAFRELARVARRYVVVTVPHRQVIPSVLCPHCLKTFPASGHFHSFDALRLRSMGQAAGLTPDRIESYSITAGLLANVLPGTLGYAANRLLQKLKSEWRGTFLAALFWKP